MTTHETFKKRVRERMTKTGERYNAARRALLARSRPLPAGNGWVSQPDVDDARLRDRTGRGYDEWASLIESGPGRDAGHTEIARWARDEHDVEPWWAQTVALGYERIIGRRLPGQSADGTFSVSRSRLVELDRSAFRAILDDDSVRDDLLPGLKTTVRSRPGTKSPRFALTDTASDTAVGVVMFSLDAVGDRIRFTVTHERIASAEAADAWRTYWTSWIDDLVG